MIVFLLFPDVHLLFIYFYYLLLQFTAWPDLRAAKSPKDRLAGEPLALNGCYDFVGLSNGTEPDNEWRNKLEALQILTRR